ncbi:MAG: hypothetical protein CL483_09915 [Acidobacteria bacterium]|nr:hypothetical protein [Acidobacteriota bacterium]|tara:strand:- start:154 stop:1050 length:897 start_codon:yes stop_codon:yes gene_type:complete
MAPIVHLASYNLQRGINYPHLLEQFGSLPELRDADIIAVQEALVPRGGRNTLARLSEDLRAGHRWSYEPVMRYSDKEYGNGFLYRPAVSVRDGRRVSLPRVARMGWLARFKTEGGVPDTKSAFVQTFDLRGCRLRIVNLHLDFAGGAEHRVAQLTHLLDMVDSPLGGGHEVDILCGDFNTSGPVSVPRVVADTDQVLEVARRRGFVDCSADVAWTSDLFTSIDDADPARRWLVLGRALGLHYRQKLDHVMVRGGVPVEPAGVVAGVVRGSGAASDHLPLTVHIDLVGRYYREDRETAR